MRLRSSAGRRLAALGFAAATATVVAVASAGAAAAAPADGTILRAGGATAVSGSYLVVFKDTMVARSAVPGKASELAARVGGRVGHRFVNAVRGFEVSVGQAMAKRLAADPAVAYVEQNHTVTLADTQTPVPSWGLDRIDQRNLPLNNSYTYPTTAPTVRAYIIDTGLRFTHTTFGGRAVTGFDAIDGGAADDCHGHGTHVGGNVGGAEYGVAKGVTVVGVRVLNCAGSGTTAQVVAGIDFVTGDHDPGELAVANMSLGGGIDVALDNAVTASIADGVSYAIAAGNSNANACNFSPARAPNAITVGATTITDARASFSNFGTCLDIFAPGQDITSSWFTSDTATNTISGTSMATPHVAGAAALVLAANPSFTPQQVRDFLFNNATNGVVTNPGTGSVNKLLFVVNDGTPPVNDFSIAVSPASGSTAAGGSVSATVSTTTTSGSPQTVNLSASGLPAGASAGFVPSSVTSGGSSALTISTSLSTPAGTFPVTITGTGASATRTTTFTLTVTGGGTPGCSGTNGTDVAIPDLSTVESLITISGCPGNGSAASTVEVHIVHTFKGDLVVNLVAPDGSLYLLHNRTGGGTDNIDQTYTVNVSSEVANGTWRLRVQDAAAIDTGFINSWTLNLGAAPPVSCSGTNGTDVAIPDLSTVESLITISGCPRNGLAASTVEVHIVHTYKGDLVVNLVAPDGSLYLLHNRTGGSTDNIDQTYTVNLSSEAGNGTWRLRVQDAAAIDVGFINSWTLTL